VVVGDDDAIRADDESGADAGDVERSRPVGLGECALGLDLDDGLFEFRDVARLIACVGWRRLGCRVRGWLDTVDDGGGGRVTGGLIAGAVPAATRCGDKTQNRHDRKGSEQATHLVVPPLSSGGWSASWVGHRRPTVAAILVATPRAAER
jgi:hypothetical protein